MDNTKDNIIGKIDYLDYNGNLIETINHTDKNSYLKSVEDGLNNNPNGFKYTTITNDPKVRKGVDDLIYGIYGEENPNDLEYYRNKYEIKETGYKEEFDELDYFWREVEDFWFPDEKKFWREREVKDFCSPDEKKVENISKLENDRISDINIFSLKNGGYAIRCKIDGAQQSAEKLSKEDVINFSEKTDRVQLAEKYFKNILEFIDDISNSIKR